MTEQAVKVPELMFRVHCGCVTKSPLHFTDIHRCIPPCSVSVTFASEESQGLGPSPLGFFSSSVPVWTAFPYPLTRVRIPAASDYYAPSDSFKDIGVSFGLPLLYSPLPLSFLRRSPVFTAEDLSLDCFAVACSSPCPFPSLGLPILFIG